MNDRLAKGLTKYIKAYALASAENIRPAAGFTRVSDEFCLKMMARLNTIIQCEVHRQPSIGKTIK